ncbi:penicillin-binding protein 1A [Arcicella rigui]|uniref:Transglycosylase domain-containing protein n=1 Tax=Arcicella rigui TaxID=797020 RepID=A0ABU5QCP8_9BACT|nr:transglycosylase domain-containing protein [Arcicella rigui]MEA5140626.1 transglycosylase domain-containing protein [Arcicella rigui]
MIKQLIQNLSITLRSVLVKTMHQLWLLLDKLLVLILGEEKVANFYKSLDNLKAYLSNVKQSIDQSFDKESAYYRPIKTLWKSFAWTVFAGVFYLFCIQTNFLWLTGEMPSVGELQNPKLSQSSEIYSEDGVLMGKFFQENRTPVKNYKDLSPYLVKALVATEDARFYQHSGIDFKATFGVVAGILRGASERGGGSTITQQLAKNLFKTRKKQGISKKGLFGYVPVLGKFVIKTKEWLTAIKLERYYTKEEIILWYLNTVDFGSNSFGIKVAAKTYFNTSPDSLNVQEAAVLVGMQKATSTYNPRRNYEKSLKRRNTVLSQMVKYGYLGKVEFDSLSKLPIALKVNEESPYDGSSNYFKTALAKALREWADTSDVDLDLYRDGLKIITTIDSRMQVYAEASVQEGMRSLQQTFDNHWSGKNPWTDEKGNEIPGFIDTVAKRTSYYKALAAKYKNNQDSIWYYMKNVKRKMWVYSRNGSGEEQMTMSAYDSIAYYKKFLQAGMMSMDPFTGHIKAWVGGLDFQYFKYDHVNQGRRQPGSTFKPFVYTTAIDGPKDMSPCTQITDEPFEIEVEEKGEKKIWRPHNADGRYSYARMSLRRAMARSINSCAAKLTADVGADSVVYYAKKMGIKSPLSAVPSIGLGSKDVTLFEMVGAYGCFLNEGMYTQPMLVVEIRDRNGKTIHTFEPERHQAIRKESALLMRYMLEGGLEEQGGTSQNLWSFKDLFDGKDRYKSRFAGKTGTTSNHSDGWYMGLTSNLVTGTWVGGDDRSIHFRSGAYGEGSKTALPLFGRYMSKIVKDPTLEAYHPVPFEKLDPKRISKPFNCTAAYVPSTDSTSNDSSYVGSDSLAPVRPSFESKPDSSGIN